MSDRIEARHKTARKTVTVTSLRAGQPRAYADSIYEAVIDFDFPDAPTMQFNPPQATVERIAKILVHDWADPSGPIEWWQPRLEALEQRGKGEWYVKVRLPYVD